MTQPTTTFRGPLGSTIHVLRADAETIEQLAMVDWNKHFRRVCLDPARGLITLMSPSNLHERLTRTFDFVVDVAADAVGKTTAGIGSTRLKGRGSPPGTGLEPDCAFYIGDSVDGFLAAEEEGEAAVDAYLESVPPDLVVEVELTHADLGKARRYGQLGMKELWQLKAKKKTRDITSMEILRLHPARPPEALSVSHVLPGLTPSQVRDALANLKSARTRQERTEAVSRAILKRGALRVREEPPEYVSLGNGCSDSQTDSSLRRSM